MNKHITGILLSCILTITAASTFSKAEENTSLEQSLSIYGWLPSLNGSLKYTIPGEGTQPEQEGESNIADSLDMVLMGNYMLRTGQWSFMADMVYLKLSGLQETTVTTPNLSNIPDLHLEAEQELTAWLLGFYGGYNILNNANNQIDVIGGMRYFSLGLDVSLSLNHHTVNVSPEIDNYDAVVGIHGKYILNENWYLPYHFDIGAGDSDLTWQASASVGYMFDWGDILLTYRYMHYGFGEDKFVNDFDLYGPKIGLVFHF